MREAWSVDVIGAITYKYLFRRIYRYEGETNEAVAETLAVFTCKENMLICLGGNWELYVLTNKLKQGFLVYNIVSCVK